MVKVKRCWVCRVFGHKFRKISDLRKTKLKRERLVYRCKRCNLPLVLRPDDKLRKVL